MALPFSFYRPEDQQYGPEQQQMPWTQFGALLRPGQGILPGVPVNTYQPPAQGLLPAETNKPGGILGFLQRPGIADALIAGGSAMVQAAQPVAGMRRPGFGAGIGAGMAGFNQGFDAYGQRIAQGQADAINQRVKLAELAKLESGQGTEWNTDYSNRVRINADRIQRDAEAKGAKMDRAEAEQLGAQYIDTLGSQNARALADLRAQHDERLIHLRNQQEIEAEGRAPDVAAATAVATETAKADVARKQDKQSDVVKAEDALAELQPLEIELKKLPSPARLKVEGAKAFFGLGDDDIQTALGKIDVISGRMLGYVNRLPGAATDADRQVFMASAGIVTNPDLPPERRIAAAQQAMDAYRRLIKKYGVTAQPGLSRQAGVAAQPPAQKPSGPAVGSVVDGFRFKGGNPSDPNSWVKVN